MFPSAPILAVVASVLIAPALAEAPPQNKTQIQKAPISATNANGPKANGPTANGPTANGPKANGPKPDGPKALGKFDDWTAATYVEAGQPVCYAFTRVLSSVPSVAGRGAVILTVTERASGRDAVAVEAGFAFAPNATINVKADQTEVDFYTHQRTAFARKHDDALTAFRTAGRAIVRSTGPRDAAITDTFSLKGFKAAYEAISKACPPK